MFSRTSSGAFPSYKLHPYPLATYISTPAINGFSIGRDGYDSHRAEAVEIATNSTSHGSQPLMGWWFPSLSCSPRSREPRRLLPTVPTNPHPLVYNCMIAAQRPSHGSPDDGSPRCRAASRSPEPRRSLPPYRPTPTLSSTRYDSTVTSKSSHNLFCHPLSLSLSRNS